MAGTPANGAGGNGAGEAQRQADAALESVVRAMGLALSHACVYGPEHRMTRNAADDSFHSLSRLLDSAGELTLGVVDNTLVANAATLDMKSPLSRLLAHCLTRLSIDSFSIQQGLDTDSYLKLLAILARSQQTAGPRVNFSAVLESARVGGVSATKVRYARIHEDEMVVPRESASRGEDAPSGAPAIERAMAFLRGEATAGDATALQGLKAMAEDVDGLTQAIFQAAAGPEQAPATDEKVIFRARRVVQSLRNAVTGLSAMSAEGPAPRRRLAKKLADVKEKLVDILAASPDEETRRQTAEVSEFLDQVTEDMLMDALVAEYERRRKALKRYEGRIRRFIRSNREAAAVVGELHQKLAQAGLSDEDWQALAPRPAGRHRRGGHAVARLERLLSRLASLGGESGAGTTDCREELAAAVREAGAEVDGLADRASARIDELLSRIREAGRPAEGPGVGEGPPTERKPLLSRRELIAMLAEIVQELCQPLTVINASIDMVCSRRLGEVNESQAAMLELAARSGERLRTLVYKLMELSDVPESLRPDAGTLSSLYE
ncbi:MAG: hypothetical protein BWZ02_02678 [Lentisphaerae bacterium ADurb.BinA184]|nr:MAG: hypothetical protein BWZ02_02678 [Lentisphaerae bacterium ADurb.BinA184]